MVYARKLVEEEIEVEKILDMKKAFKAEKMIIKQL